MIRRRHSGISDGRAIYRIGAQHFGARLRAIRVERDLSLEQASACTGIAATTLAELETAAGIPGIRTLERLCSGLGVSLAGLLEQ